MGCYTYITDQDKKNWSSISDINLNGLFQEARHFDNSILISERTYTVKRLFRKPHVQTVYTVYHEAPAADGSTYQARHQICVGHDAKSVATYLYGIINGAYAIENRRASESKSPTS